MTQAPHREPPEHKDKIVFGRAHYLLLTGTAIFLLAALLLVVSPADRTAPPAAPGTTGGATMTPSARPQPWEYDPVNDRHWHEGHGHWHAGPPPPEATGGPTPEPWEYDSINDRHWYADHGHWHAGPPPPPEERH